MRPWKKWAVRAVFFCAPFLRRKVEKYVTDHYLEWVDKVLASKGPFELVALKVELSAADPEHIEEQVDAMLRDFGLVGYTSADVKTMTENIKARVMSYGEA